MFTGREIFEDSGWAVAFQNQSPDKSNYLAVLGFETNNPIHDDHDGRGPHFHLSLRSKIKARTKSPAFYLNPEDGSISVELNTKSVELTASDLFRVFRLENELGIGPIVRLKNARTGMYLYVRESEQGYSKGIFQTNLDDGEFSDNASWILLSSSPDTLMLCNVRAGCFVNVDSKHTKLVDHLFQSTDFKSPGSHWTIHQTKNGHWSFSNVLSKFYMHAFFSIHALPAAQFDQENEGSEWIMDFKSGDQWVPITSLQNIPPRYTAAVTTFSEFQAGTKIFKNGNLWSNVSFNRRFIDDRVGVIEVNVNFEQKDVAPKSYKIEFDKLTGKERQVLYQ
jgi:hypothetical protein